jgi:hypothetical protein
MSRERPTTQLRFVLRDSKRILQQRWELPYVWTNTQGEPTLEYEYEWRDVPSLDNDPGNFA